MANYMSNEPRMDDTTNIVFMYQAYTKNNCHGIWPKRTNMIRSLLGVSKSY